MVVNYLSIRSKYPTWHINPLEFSQFCDENGITVERSLVRDSYIIEFPDGKVTEIGGKLLMSITVTSLNDLLYQLHEQAK